MIVGTVVFKFDTMLLDNPETVTILESTLTAYAIEAYDPHYCTTVDVSECNVNRIRESLPPPYLYYGATVGGEPLLLTGP
jgi:hypothetical protein